LKCYTTALVLYRWMLNSIRKRTLDSADIWCYMGIAYYHLPAEDLYSRNANLRAAIACYQIALYVYTDNNILEKRARINRYLGDAYMEMLEEDWATNLEAAMACYEIARLYCPEGVPEGAKTDQRLGRAYYTFATHSLSKNERKESLDKALSQYEAALHVCKPRTEIWATVQYELGLVHNCLNQPQEATKCYDRALEVYTEQNSPRKHAETSYRKGIAHVMLFHQTQHQSCLREAQLCYSNALSTYNKLKLIDEVKSVRESIEQLQKIRL